MESRFLSSHRGADCLERPVGSTRRECVDRPSSSVSRICAECWPDFSPTLIVKELALQRDEFERSEFERVKVG